jgi:hypothetical protein
VISTGRYEKCHLFKVVDAIFEFSSSPIIKNYTSISSDDLESKMSNLKDKWAGYFDNLSKISKENIKTGTISYVNFNNGILSIVSQAREELIYIDKQFFETNMKQEITIPPL